MQEKYTPSNKQEAIGERKKKFSLKRAIAVGGLAISTVAAGAGFNALHSDGEDHEHGPKKPDNVAAAERIATDRYDICELGEVEDLQTLANPEEYGGLSRDDGEKRGKVRIHLNVVENPEVKHLMEEHSADTDPVHWSIPAVTTRAIIPDSANPGKYQTIFAPMKHTPTQLDRDELPTDITLFPKEENPVGTMTGIYINTSSDTDTEGDRKTASSEDPDSHVYNRRVENDKFCGALRLEEVDGKKTWRKVEGLDIAQPKVAISYRAWQTPEVTPVE